MRWSPSHADTSRSLGDSNDLPLPEWTKIFTSHVVIFSSKVQLAHDYRQVCCQLVISRRFCSLRTLLAKIYFHESPLAILRLIRRADVCWRISALLRLKLLSVLTLSVLIIYFLCRFSINTILWCVTFVHVSFINTNDEYVLVLPWFNNDNCKKSNQNYEFLILFCYWFLLLVCSDAFLLLYHSMIIY